MGLRGNRGAPSGASRGRIPVALSCLVCGARNYKTTKAQKDGATPLTLRKYCKHCNQHTEHEEAK